MSKKTKKKCVVLYIAKTELVDKYPTQYQIDTKKYPKLQGALCGDDEILIAYASDVNPDMDEQDVLSAESWFELEQVVSFEAIIQKTDEVMDLFFDKEYGYPVGTTRDKRKVKELKEASMKRAKARQGERTDLNIPENLPELKEGDSRDIAAGKLGMSGKTLERGIEVLDAIDGIKVTDPEKAAEIKAALNKSVNSAASIVKPIVEEKKKTAAEVKSAKYKIEETDDHLFIQRSTNDKYRPTFNATNDSIEWAKWSWNPVTGCCHGCEYCYARAMAENEYYADTFLTKFEPTFHPGRLLCPDNHVIPAIRKSEPGINNVFLCSMADLFGDWVPDEWILQILEVIARHPEYNFIALTKNPKRYLKFTFPKNIWLGATADTQKRFDVAMDVFRLMRKCENIKFLSCEPLLEKIDFIDDCGEFEEFDADNMHEYEERMERYNDHLSHLENEHRTKVVTLGYVDWVIIGGLKGSENSTKQPNWGWVETLIEFARKSNAAVYFKTNLTVVPKELPAGVETVSSPVQGQLLS